MADNSTEVQARLDATARLLAESGDIEPAARRALTELVEEMRTALRSGKVTAGDLAPLAERTAALAESLHHGHEAGVLEQVQEGFREAVVGAEVRYPVAAGLARGVLDTLAGFGI
jgi:hypothetical protein